MPTGRASSYKRYNASDLAKGVTLEPPADALRAYICAENGTVRWAYSSDQKIEPLKHLGMPLAPNTAPVEFDTDLHMLQLWSGAQDSVAHVYYFKSS